MDSDAVALVKGISTHIGATPKDTSARFIPDKKGTSVIVFILEVEIKRVGIRILAEA